MICPWCSEVAGAPVSAVLDHYKEKHPVGYAQSIGLSLFGTVVLAPIVATMLADAFGTPRRGGWRIR